ncbi:OmpA family protein [uncultured Sulfitobacter sp.]|uniref:OmpA family protein n=1 Tax=uncultured Sulfitobacter sp. TaxID=191468 RepID=UPI0026299EB1|nr:OmpA family protein [uncultured Sulfitobacter sp.]
MKLVWLALLLGIAGTAQAVELQLPNGARQMISRDTLQDRFFAPTGPFEDGVLPTRMIEGSVQRSAWRIDVAGLTPLQLADPLRRQLEEAGYQIVLDCAARACGGYDFRFAAEVLPAPNMYVNIRNFHVLTAMRSLDGVPEEAVNILASASSGASFVQIIQAGIEEPIAVGQSAVPVSSIIVPQGDIAQELSENGHAVLSDLEFESGTSALGTGPFATLEALAQALLAQADMRVALVGHTDNIGSLEGNTALSISRASAVRDYLINRFEISASRLEAQGAGYLAPITTNGTEEGRETNRRVEAVVLSE